MQFSTDCCDSNCIPLGQRRGRSDLARFSLDLSWARGVSEFAQSRAYPSPPMSGSPPPPLRRKADFDGRAPGGFGGLDQNVARSVLPPRTEPRDIIRGTRPGPYPQSEPRLPASYPAYQMMGDVPMEQSQYPYPYPGHQHQQRMPQQQQVTPMPMYHAPPQPASSYPGADTGPIAEPSGYASPKAQRKTKGHVASACVPCKRAHLRCDAQRPCSRCLSNGKEDACVDVQHKKRGKPRLRDERESRYEGLGSPFAPPAENAMGPPGPAYSSTGSPLNPPESLPRSSSYRILKSQGGPPDAATGYSSQPQVASRIVPIQDYPSLYLTMDLQIVKASLSFRDATGILSVGGRRLLDIVASADRDKVYRLQRLLEEDRQEREPNYLPPIFGKSEEERIIYSISMAPEDIAQFRLERQEVFAFQGADGQQRISEVRVGLAKKDSTYFVIFVLVMPATPGPHHLSSSSFPRGPQYGYQTPQQVYGQPTQASPYSQYVHPYGDPRTREAPGAYGQPQSLGSAPPPAPATSSTTPAYAQSFTRPEYQPQQGRQVPRSEMTGQMNIQSELQLPPIRNHPAGSGSNSRMDDRSGRFDIRGLIDKPDSSRRQQR